MTTVSKTYYEQNLSQLEIKPLKHLLEVEAANGQLIPYLGYIEIDVVFPKAFLGVEKRLTILALVIVVANVHSLQSVMTKGTAADCSNQIEPAKTFVVDFDDTC